MKTRLLTLLVALFVALSTFAQNNTITYTASAKLAETTSSSTSGLHTNAFNVSISSHTFSNGVGTITFSSDVTSIGNYAFRGCSGLTSITIPSSVTSIGDYAFRGCSSLTSITIPNSVTSIGNYAFYGCSGLTSITIPDDVTSIGNSAFSGCSGLTSIIIPSSVTSIGNYAFSYCSGLTSITIPSSVTSIGDSAFRGCSSLTSITIPSSVTSIGDYAFRGCSSLTSITIPSSVTSIGSYAFYYCDRLTYFTIENEDTVIPYTTNMLPSDVFIFVPRTLLSAYKSAEGWSNRANLILATDTQTEYTLSATAQSNNSDIATQIGLANLSKVIKLSVSGTINSYDIKAIREKMPILRELDLSGASIVDCSYTYYYSLMYNNSYHTEANKISGYMFYQLSSLKSIQLPNNVTSIGEDAFSGCSGLTSITIPNSVTSIGDWAFSGCSGLTSITIPNSVTSIGGWAFSGCSGLTSITIPSSVTSIGVEAFSGCSGLTSITIPESVTSIGGYAFKNCSGLTSITIPEGVTSILNYVFYGCSGLTSITIPSSVTSIGEDAFRGCSGLTSITIPSSVTSIGNSAFSGCSGLTSITSLAKTPPSLSSSCFSGVDKTIPLTVPCGKSNDYFWANGWSDFTNIVEDDCNKVVLTIQSNNSTMGSVSAGDEYTIGTTVEISATANYGFRFSAWSDGNTDNPRLVMVESDTTFTALFDIANFFLVNRNISPTIAAGSIEGPDSVLYMHEGTYTAIANEGYLFEAWSDGTTANPRTITVMGDTTIQALFIRYEKVIVHDTTYIDRVDTIIDIIHDTTYIDRVDTIEMVTATSMDPIAGEARLLVQAIPADGYEFFCWDDFNLENPRVVDVSDGEPKVYTAVFRAKVNTATREESAPATYTQTYDILGRQADNSHRGIKVSPQGKTIGK